MKKGKIFSNDKSEIFVKTEEIVSLNRFSQVNIGYFQVPSNTEILEENEYLSRNIIQQKFRRFE